jgi:curved DNA-binding protein CbpA
MAANLTHYAVLGVPPTATGAEITRAYHALAAKYHPDKSQDPDGAMFKLINKGRSVLLDPGLRAAYDAELAGPPPPPPPPPPPKRQKEESWADRLLADAAMFEFAPEIFRMNRAAQIRAAAARERRSAAAMTQAEQLVRHGETTEAREKRRRRRPDETPDERESRNGLMERCIKRVRGNLQFVKPLARRDDDEAHPSV